MKCPNCGFELAEDQLYCESCGEEIQIVPDFEPEIENSIIESLSTVAEEIEMSSRTDKPETGEEEAVWKGKSTKKRKSPSPEAGKIDSKIINSKEETQPGTGLIVSIGSFVGVIILSLIIGIRMYHTNSASYQITQAQEYADAGNYQKAVEYMERADVLLPENADILYTKATYHYLNREPDKAIGILIPMTQSDRYTVEEKEKCYERIIDILNEQERYREISDLLISCDNEALVTRYQSYLAMEPEFSIAPGSYAEVIPLKLSSNTSGKIYYTVNGSKPTVNSKVYTSPIFLETGDYIVSALFVNEYGLESEIVRNSYHIDLLVPDSPEIALFSGLYVEPMKIEVVVPQDCEVYYTTNGDIPTADSTRYAGPISMPLGRTDFTFVSISAEGVSSNTVTRSYEFRLISDITTPAAIENIMRALVKQRVLIDMTGKGFGLDGYYEYQFDTLIEIPGKGLYYKIDEYYRENNGGTSAKTERLYAVEAYVGTPNRLIYNDQGEMDLISLE